MSMFIGHKAERQELMALSRVNEDKILLELLRNRIEGMQESLLTASEPEMIYRLQGKIGVLKEFLAAAAKSREVLERR